MCLQISSSVCSDSSSSDGLTVLIADDHALIRDGMRGLLGEVLGRDGVHCLEVADGEALLRAARANPGVRLALVDLNMPGMERGQRLAELAHRCPGLPLVVISALTSPDVVRRTLELPSVHAFVPKSAPSEQITEAIRAALQGRRLPFAHRAPESRRPDVVLTPRMEEIRQLLRQGMSNKLIARTLGISEGTVKNHMSEIFKALQVSNRTQAAQFDADQL
ncbi:response regulator transcription factor [Hydrogenophaga laconesensis]|uniref:DNA-binding NarL/FixJ family response regulator n=1 Tax=Hydrogenophaga laconesensis TaxID=1805971 RepID=A0ABU1VFX2_9BURK|nr:response regulator transcription factor [Hydrogenophaga laconesensis]MDR7096357.1 DNA-binding NarL/FixJ family response regulator [Hydrogenophaga laconesensis]